MHASVKVFTLASVALLSCRAVLGIEDIEEGQADGGASDAAADSVGTDSATDTGIDTGVDAGVCSGKTGNDCGKCCRDLAGPGLKDLENIIKPCLCDGGCAGQCGPTNLCAGATDPVGTQCIPCMDTAIKSNQCPKERNDCFAKAPCKPVYDCIAACK